MTKDWRELLSSLPDGAQIDTHVHTTYSDGTDSPSNVIAIALAVGLAGIAFADHDSIDGYLEAQNLFLPPKFLIVPGVELTAYDGDEEVHILGYGFDPQSDEFNAYLRLFADKRRDRAKCIVYNLQQVGVQISWESLEKKYGTSAIGRPHIARELVACGGCRTIGQAFYSFLGNNSAFVVPKYNISISDAASLVHRAGGMAILAHPGALPEHVQVTPLVECGLDGLEANYPFHHPMQERAFQRYCEKRGLAITGGSDYHGSNRASVKVGARASTAASLKKLLL